MTKKIWIAAAMIFCLALPASGAAKTVITSKDCQIVKNFSQTAQKGATLPMEVFDTLVKYRDTAKPAEGTKIKNCVVVNRCSFQPSCQDIETEKEKYTIFMTNHMRYIVDFKQKMVLNVTRIPKSNL